MDRDPALEQSADPRDPRKNQLLRASLHVGPGQVADVLVRNMSEMGVGGLMRSDHQLRQGQSVTIRLADDLSRQGTVKWTKASKFGIELSERIGVSKIRELLESKTSAKGGQWTVSRLHKVSSEPPRPSGQQRPVG